MFGLKNWINKCVTEFLSENLNDLLNKYIENNYKVCETSKALIVRKGAVKGEDEIRTEATWSSGLLFGFYEEEKKIYTPYYSPAFAPKKKEVKKS